MKKLLTKVFGSRNERLIKKYQKVVDKINVLEEKFAALSDDKVQAKTQELKTRLKEGASLNDILPEAFATVREASKRVLGMRHYDVQLIGAMVLNSGKIAEMKTGEGKTLTATLAVYLNALSERGVHVVTVNDYLAERDAAWMGQIYTWLGLEVGVITSAMGPDGRHEAYAADITYGTNNEFGFDYLRDNMAFAREERVQRGHAFAIVDEVDSILIDEARTPLVISGPTDDQSDLYKIMNEVAPLLQKQEAEDGPGDFSVEEKNHQVLLTEDGHEKVEDILVKRGVLNEGESLYDAANITLMHHLYAALRAYAVYQKNVHYIVQNNQIVIVDEFTGRTMPGRRWSDGLHQAVEAKEGVAIQNENQTMASITFQNYFRLYERLSGMTGTADTEAFELQQTYGLEVVVIPTHQPMVREDNPDKIFLNQKEKYEAVAEDIEDCLKREQPVLVGTASIEASEYLSGLLNKKKIKHEVLNAKQHEREAHIIEQAGAPGAVTIATNMAGRGTDIVLGGSLDAEVKALGENVDTKQVEDIKNKWQKLHDKVVKSGGLHVIGSERHESRRIDNQLRGRSGRQGGPGSSRFYLSLEDALMRMFAPKNLGPMMQKLGMEEGEAIEHKWINRAIENAQRKVEGHNFDIRKQLLEYDDVANDQRKVVYEQRNDLMNLSDVSDMIKTIREDIIHDMVNLYIPPGSMEEQWNVEGLASDLQNTFDLDFPIARWLEEDDELYEETLRQKIIDKMEQVYADKEQKVGSEVVRHFEKAAMLNVLDHHWKEHLQMMDHLRQGIHLRGYAQKNPKQEYKREAFAMFQDMLEKVKKETTKIITLVKVQDEQDVQAIEDERRQSSKMQFQHAASDVFADEPEAPAESQEKDKPFVRDGRKVGRNEPCPCGSGKKYKHCHGKLK